MKVRLVTTNGIGLDAYFHEIVEWPCPIIPTKGDMIELDFFVKDSHPYAEHLLGEDFFVDFVTWGIEKDGSFIPSIFLSDGETSPGWFDQFCQDNNFRRP